MPIPVEDLIKLNDSQEHSETDDFTLERYQQFMRHFPPGARDVLEIGCNTGRGGEFLIRQNPSLHITGLDPVSDRLDRIPKSIYHSTLSNFADDIPLPNNSFDAIIAGEVIEHIPGSSVASSLHEFFRLLRLKGRLLLTTPNPHYIKNWIQHKSVLLDSSHVSQHTPSSMRRKLEDAGFSHIRIYGSGRLTRKVGQHLPILSAYGSYLAVGDKW